MDFFRIFKNGIKAGITPVITKLRYWTSLSFIRTRIFESVKKFFRRFLDIRPENERDYYGIFGLLVSKRLVFLLILSSGVLCLYYLLYVNPPSAFTEGAGEGVRVYSYRSLPLRFFNGRVRIKAKSGYIAYEGEVKDGAAQGTGILYEKKGRTVYEGQFSGNQYEGQGVLYYLSGGIHYQGDFSANLFQGSGKLYRENGTLWYEGEFLGGKQNGSGTLYDASEKKVFTGLFQGGGIVYSQLLGKGADEIAALYSGRRRVWLGERETVAELEDIDALYAAAQENNSIEEGGRAEKVLVCSDSFLYGQQRLRTIREIKEALGEPDFEGNSYMTFPEAVGITRLESQGKDTGLYGVLSAEETYEEVRENVTWRENSLVYLYIFQKDDLTYTFVCSGKNGGFLLWQIEKTEVQA